MNVQSPCWVALCVGLINSFLFSERRKTVSMFARASDRWFPIQPPVPSHVRSPVRGETLCSYGILFSLCTPLDSRARVNIQTKAGSPKLLEFKSASICHNI